MPLETLKARIDRLPDPSRRLQLGFAIAVLATQALIAMTGAVVRVTGSGLGCPTWPQCFPGSMVPVEHPEYDTLNQWIEYGNRLFTGVVGIIAGVCFVLAYLHRPRTDRRYLRLAAAMPIGVVIQAVIGGLTVRLDLVWWSVAVHLLASTIMVWLATLLVHAVPRETVPDRPVPAGTVPAGTVPGTLSTWLYVQTGLLAGLLVTGTMVTGAGPHGGDPETPRFDVPVETMAHVHAAFLYAFLGSLVLLGIWLGRQHAFPPPWRRYQVLVAVVLAQGTIGFAQFWTGVPELLVCLHVLGAMCVIIATGSLWCGVRGRATATDPAGDLTVANATETA
ncbi:COX15/CtaA family protein [Actinophytocola algeriensis]|uniref:Cytochrome c oxidase assembly protein subunit 15 n=1 Tax=Actinophytocola algeriensis TaxID=1768010 RepID=A0A7W7Q8P6_9PSEU|nr:COX15/CtaA family protein [Actinophytocola algeriensis]MBB4909081.1 cytochrome c oxidase assembly protein subunit 15 [Actinophytocola algeriensis]MBE1474531.1 cytochrome c oxidase assembly protein subunit 15 [Actinophytocola algeriensis]